MAEAARRTIQPDDLFKLKFQAARFSPDGTQICYAVAWSDLEKDQEVAALFVRELASHADCPD